MTLSTSALMTDIDLQLSCGGFVFLAGADHIPADGQEDRNKCQAAPRLRETREEAIGALM